MLTEFLLAAGLLTAPDCTYFAANTSAPIEIVAKPLTGRELGATEDRVGVFRYEGHGIRITSDDPRFQKITVVPGGNLIACGYAVHGPTGWNAHDRNLSDWDMRLEFGQARAEPPPGTIVAAQHGAIPALEGHVSIATWPAQSKGRTFFLGLMQPLGNEQETIVIAFADAPAPSKTIVVAQLPLRVQGLSSLPDIHGPDYSISLSGVDSDKGVIRIFLTLEPEQAADIVSQLNP